MRTLALLLVFLPAIAVAQKIPAAARVNLRATTLKAQADARATRLRQKEVRTVLRSFRKDPELRAALKATGHSILLGESVRGTGRDTVLTRLLLKGTKLVVERAYPKFFGRGEPATERTTRALPRSFLGDLFSITDELSPHDVDFELHAPDLLERVTNWAKSPRTAVPLETRFQELSGHK
jgi:hypothetical protein